MPPVFPFPYRADFLANCAKPESGAGRTEGAAGSAPVSTPRPSGVSPKSARSGGASPGSAAAGAAPSSPDRLALDFTVLAHPAAGDDARPDGALRWELLNSGAAPWPCGTALRLIGGSSEAVAAQSADVDAPDPEGLRPGESVVVELPLAPGRWSVASCSGGELSPHLDGAGVEVSFALVAPGGRLFGTLLLVRLRRVEQPRCATVSCPGAAGFAARAGEVLALEWWLANIGASPWPEDLTLALVESPAGVQMCVDAVEMAVPPAGPQMTVQVVLQVVAPPEHGHHRLQWAVRSPTFPDFGHQLTTEIHIGDARAASPPPATLAPSDTRGPVSLVVPDKEPPAPPPDPAMLADALERVRLIDDWDQRDACHATLLKVLRNVHAAPEKAKFRRLPLASQKLVSSVLEAPGGRDALLAAGFAEDGDALVLPPAIRCVEATLLAVQSEAERAAMDRMRRDRDCRIHLEKEKAGQKTWSKGRKLDQDMLDTLAKSRDDQQLLLLRRDSGQLDN